MQIRLKNIGTPLLIIAFSMPVFINCGNKSVGNESKDPVLEYQAFVDGLIGTGVIQIRTALTKYTVLFKGQKPEVCDRGFLIFYNFYTGMEMILNDRSGENLEGFDSLIYVAYPPEGVTLPKRWTNLKNDLAQSGYEVAVAEGSAYYQRTSGFLKAFDSYVTPATRDFYTHMDIELTEPMMIDGRVNITTYEFVERMLWWMDFVEKNPDSPFREETEDRKKMYINAIVRGSDNEPLVSGNTISITPFFEGTYDELLRTPSKLATRLKPYWEAVKANDIKKLTSIQQALQAEGLIY